jgi:hypothetical protein
MNAHLKHTLERLAAKLVKPKGDWHWPERKPVLYDQEKDVEVIEAVPDEEYGPYGWADIQPPNKFEQRTWNAASSDLLDPHPVSTAVPPEDVIACGASPDIPLCADCIDAYRNGIEPGETACEARAQRKAAQDDPRGEADR